MRKIFNLLALLIVTLIYSQKPVLEQGVYRSNVKGQKVMLKVGEDNNYEMSFLYGKYTTQNDTITFKNMTSGESSFKIKINEAPFSSTFKIKILTEYMMYFGSNIYIGTQKDDNTIVEFKSLEEYLGKNASRFRNRQKEINIDVEKTKYLYFVENNYEGKGSTISKFQIDLNANELEITYEPSFNILELKGLIDPETKKLSILEGLNKNPIFTFEKDGTPETKNDLLKPLQVVFEKDWLKNSGFAEPEDTTAFFGEREASQYNFKHTNLKNYQDAIKSIEKTPTKFLVIVVDNSKDGKKSFDQFIKEDEMQLSRVMRRQYNSMSDHFNYYYATDKDKALLDGLKIKDKSSLVFLNSNGEMVYHTNATLKENPELFQVYNSVYDEINKANAKLKLDKITANKKATLPDFKKALFDIVTTKKGYNNDYSDVVADTVAVGVSEDYDTMAVDTTVATVDAVEDYDGDYYHVNDPENLYAFKTSKQVIAQKWKLIVDFYTKNGALDDEFIQICKKELNDSGFTFKLFEEKKQVSDLDFKILDYIFKNYEAILKLNDTAKIQSVDNYEDEYYPKAPNLNTDISVSLSSFFQKQLSNYDKLDNATKNKLVNYYKLFMKLSGYNISDFNTYLQKIDESNPTDKSFYYSEFEDFYQTIISKNSSLIESLDEMYANRKNNYTDWDDFKNSYTRLANTVAWNVVETKVNDKKIIQNAINWSESSLKVDKKNAYYLDTLAQLYYKNNEREKAIVTEQKAIEAIEISNITLINEYKEVLEKMKNGTY
ncbi:hypothetical protein OX283_008395 [Flavobacterium sp. SUN052]|uniref:hypothetical protein n=1 Tax=Flavobacterium sp. SUN052 TaxID=3002441 RepID=UPI00237D8E4D|nr:hypothetical protein [Flavobacterium sp. SUN052]MEC4004673.1 hypothetical protein [Flavobacterium sp. SUN052]